MIQKKTNTVFIEENDCIKRFCSELKELETKVINYKQKETTPLTDDESKYYEEQKECYICQKEFWYNKNQIIKFKSYKKVRSLSFYRTI